MLASKASLAGTDGGGGTDYDRIAAVMSMDLSTWSRVSSSSVQHVGKCDPRATEPAVSARLPTPEQRSQQHVFPSTAQDQGGKFQELCILFRTTA